MLFTHHQALTLDKLLTIMASLWMITTRVFIFIFGIPPRSDIIGKVAMYMDAASICLLCLLIIFLEFDWLRVMQYFGFASFYVGKAIIQVMCGVFAFGAALEGIYQTLAETASYFMFGVGVLHFALGIFCLEKYCLGVRSSYQQLNK